MNKTICFSICLFTIFACSDPDKIRYERQVVDNCKWPIEKTLIFEIPVEDSTELYDLLIDIRNRTDYPFANLCLFISAEAPNGAKSTDTVNYTLADEAGEWTGSGYLSNYRENRFVFRNNIRFPENGNYSIKIRHGMRHDTLNGIFSIGLRLEKHKNKYK